MKRVNGILEDSVKIHKMFCLTDSAVALHWIMNVQKKYKKYVGSRSDKIRKLLPLNVWRHVSGVENGADLPAVSDHVL